MTRSITTTKQPWVMAVGVAAALSSLTLYARTADACSCRPPPGPAEALASADAVFEGRAASSTTRPSQGLSVGSVTVPFTVLRAWKGAPGSGSLTVTTSGSSASCGYSFAAGETYIVYAYRDSSGALTTSICSRTRRSADGAEDIAAFGAPGGAGSSSPPSTTGAPPTTTGGAEGNTTGAPPSPAEPPSSGAEPLGAPAPNGDPPAAAPPPAPPSGGCAACAVPSGALPFNGNAPAFAALLGLAALLRRITGRQR